MSGGCVVEDSVSFTLKVDQRKVSFADDGDKRRGKRERERMKDV